MRSFDDSKWRVRGLTFVVSGLAAASLAYWALQGWGGGRPSQTPQRLAAPAPALDARAVARALGGGAVVAVAAPGAAAPAAGRRFVLLGVVADRASSGAALISVDGKPAKPFRVGDSVDGRLILKWVQGRQAVLAAGPDAPAELTLELPRPAK